MSPRSLFPIIPVYSLLLTGCMGTPVVTSTPNSCSALLPSSWKDGVSAPELPGDETVGSWVAFGDAAIGKLDQANGRTRDAIEVVSRCEERDAKAVTKASKGWLGRLFS